MTLRIRVFTQEPRWWWWWAGFFPNSLFEASWVFVLVDAGVGELLAAVAAAVSVASAAAGWLAFVQIILGGGKPLAIQWMLVDEARTTFVSLGSIVHFGATLFLIKSKSVGLVESGGWSLVFVKVELWNYCSELSVMQIKRKKNEKEEKTRVVDKFVLVVLCAIGYNVVCCCCWCCWSISLNCLHTPFERRRRRERRRRPQDKRASWEWDGWFIVGQQLAIASCLSVSFFLFLFRASLKCARSGNEFG